jgi:serine/threonine-protein kinase
MVSRIGDVKLLDFGIMKSGNSVSDSASKTELGTVKGNVDFMSPEQARGRDVDQRSDLFSVGLVLHHCVAREPLYQGDSLYDRLNRAASGPGPEELARLAALPAPIAQLLARALQVDPDGRFQTATEFRSAVSAHIAGGEGELASLIGELFAAELQAEVDLLASVTAPPRVEEQPDRKSG